MESDDISLLVAQLRSRSLLVRLSSLSNLSLNFMQDDSVKIGLLKRVYRNVLLAVIDGYYVEKLWIQKSSESLVSSIAFHSSTGDAATLNPLAAFLECVVEVATQANLYTKYDDFKSSMLLTITISVISQLDSEIVSDDLTHKITGQWCEVVCRLTSCCIGLAPISSKSLDRSLKSLNLLKSSRPDLYLALINFMIQGTSSNADNEISTLAIIGNKILSLKHRKQASKKLVEEPVDPEIAKFQDSIEVHSPEMSKIEIEIKRKLIDFLVKRGLTEKKYLGSLVYHNVTIYGKCFESEDWSVSASATATAASSGDSLETAILKSLKKAPESNSGMVLSLLSNLSNSIDLSGLIIQGANAGILKMLKSSEEHIQVNGLEISKLISSRCSSIEAFSLWVQTLVDAAMGKGGLLSQIAQRIYVVSAICEAATFAFKFTDSSLSSDKNISGSVLNVLNCLVAVLEKEVDEQGKNIIGLSLSRWLVVASKFEISAEIDKFIVASIVTGLSKEKLRTTYLMTTSLACIDSEIFSTAISSHCFDLILSHLKEVIKKPIPYQPDAIFSWNCLVSMVTSSRKANLISQMESLKFWDTIYSAPTSFLVNSTLSSTLVQNFQSNEVSNLLTSSANKTLSDFKIFPSFLSMHFSVAVANSILNSIKSITSSPELSRHVVASLSRNNVLISFILRFCCHSSSNVRFLSFAALDKLKSIGIVELFSAVEGLNSLLADWSNTYKTQNAARLANFKSTINFDDLTLAAPVGSFDVRTIVPPDSRLRDIIENFCNFSSFNISQFQTFPQISKLLSSIIVQVSHEFVNTSMSKCLSHFRYTISPILVEVIKTIDDSERIASDVASELKLLASHSNELIRKSVHNSIISLLSSKSSDFIQNDKVWQSFASGVSQAFLKLIATSLQTADIVTTISEEDLKKTLNSEAIIQAAIANEVETTVDLRITNADRRKDTNLKKGGIANQDDEWVDRVKQEKLAKIASDTAVVANQVRARITAEIDVVKARVNKVINETICCLDSLNTIVQFLPDLESCKILACQFLPIVIVLSRCELAEHVGLQVIEAFANRILGESMKLESGKRDIIDSIRIITSLVDRPLREFKSETQQTRLTEISNRLGPLQRCLSLIYNHNRSLVLHPSLTVLIFPIVRGILQVYSMTANPLPGCEHAFFILNMLFPDAFFSISVSQNSNLRQCIQNLFFLNASLIDICLRLLPKFKSTVQVSPETLLMRMVNNRSTPFDQAEWTALLGCFGLTHSEHSTRLVTLRLIFTLFARSDGNFSDVSFNPSIISKLWSAKFDENQNCQELANQVWNILNQPLNANFYSELSPLLCAEATSTKATSMTSSVELAVSSIALTRVLAAKAIAGGLQMFPELLPRVISDLQTLFMSIRPVSASDANGKPKSTKGLDMESYMAMNNNNIRNVTDKKFSIRVAIAHTFLALGKQETFRIESDRHLIMDLLSFLLNVGVIDPISDVRTGMMEAGRALVDNYGGKGLGNEMLTYLQTLLSRTPGKDENLDEFDYRYESGVVLLGVAGKHMNTKGEDDGSMAKIADTLIDALKTPSEAVQQAVAESLAPLIQSIKANPAFSDRIKVWIETIMNRIVDSESYGERRGAAFGLSALVKGLGIPSLKQFDVVNFLKEACGNGSAGARQGCLAAFECLSDRLGLLFEPYIITVIPVLLKSFSHGSELVRDAAQTAASVIMNKLSAHGVKQILTPVMASFADPQWKTRQEAIRLLGSMAHCAPRQLAACLPQIIPKLVECSQTEHPRVKETAKASLSDISSVIKNPEISRLSPVLISALVDPNQFTKAALVSLLECEFMHSIDATALAIVVPILFRSLKDRFGDIKRKASAITGNMINMVGDAKILAPYVPQLILGLKDCLIDPTPDVRATSAKALGSIVGGVGEEECDDIVAWLLVTIVNEASPVERSGAAQALAEVGHALGLSRLTEIFSQVFALHSSPLATSREGLMWFLTFLPPILLDDFGSFLKRSLQVTLIGLSDESEGVREVSLRSGKVIVASIGKTFATEIIPILCESMFDEDNRIRHNSVVLIGDLLFLLGDIRGVTAQEAVEDDNEEADVDFGGDYKAAASRVLNMIKSHIGDDMMQDVLASLYISRSDTSIIVRQSALQVWKSVVFNTPKTLIDILPCFISHIIPKLASTDSELRLVAGRAIGEVVKRQGNMVLPALFPHLRDGLSSDDESMRQGICLGLAEIVSAATKKQIEDYIDTIIFALQQALCDDSADVRAQAARAFVVLNKNIGLACLEAIVPSLLERLSNEMAEGIVNCEPSTSASIDIDSLAPSLRAMRAIVQVRPRDLFDFLVPRMTVSPISLINATVLRYTADAASTIIHHHFGTFVNAFMRELTSFTSNNIDNEHILEDYISNSSDIKRFIGVKEAAGCVMGACSNAGVIFLVQELGKVIENDSSASIRRWGCWLLEMFMRKSGADVTEYGTVLLKYVLSRVAESDKKLLTAVSESISALFTKLTSDEMLNHIDFIRNCLVSCASEARYKVDPMLLKMAQSASGGDASAASASPTSTELFILPLLTIPKSIEPFMTIYIHGLMTGSSAQVREASAIGMGEIIKVCDPVVLKPYLIKSTGPLIRVAGDRHPSSLKSAIIETLMILLDKGGANLKAFAPQLQTTFVKSLQDPSRITRSKACAALGKLMSITTRIDPLLNEFCTLAISAESVAIRASIFDALSVVLLGAGDKSTPAVSEKAIALITSHISDDEDNIRTSAASCFLGVGTFIDLPAIEKLVTSLSQGFTVNSSSNWNLISGKCLAVGSLLQSGFLKIEDVRDSKCIDDAFELIDICFSSSYAAAKLAACQATLTMISAKPSPSTKAFISRIFEVFAGLISRCISDPNAASDLKKCAITIVKKASKLHHAACIPFYKQLLPPVLGTLSTADLSVKYISDRALFYAIGGRELTNIQPVASVLDAESARNLRDYSKRILSKLAVDSEDEGN